MISDFLFVLRALRRTKRLATRYPNSDDSLAWRCLIDNDSYRLSASSNQDSLIGCRVFVRTIKRWFSNRNSPDANLPFDALVLGGGSLDAKETLDYIKAFSGYNNVSIIYRDLVGFSSVKNPAAFLVFMFWGLHQAFYSVFCSRRSNHALIISIVCEIAFILNTLKKQRVHLVYDYLPYEAESNFMYLVFHAKGITVTKLPSAGPLSTHHSRTLAHSVVITNAYHVEEINGFGNNFRTGSLLRWPPERAYKCIPKYSGAISAAPPNTLGFYSHGQWLRNRLNHAQYGSAIEQDEIRILNFISQISLEINAKVYLYLHPRELKPEVFPDTEKFYEQHLSGISYEIKIHPDSTAMHFEEVDIAIAAFSTIVFERLYFGFKILIGTEAMPNFPIKGSPLNNICFSNYSDFRQKILAATNISNQEFFEKNQLQSYLYMNFLKDL